jgi:RES domain-containing protein
MINSFGVQPQGVFTFNTDTCNTFDYQGTLFRCVLPSYDQPLDSSYAQQTGGRWNPPGSFAVLYTFTSPQTAQTWLDTRWSALGFTWDEIEPAKLPDLVVMDAEVEGLADVATDEGLQAFGLPAVYPVGFETSGSYSMTQAIGVQIHDRQGPGLVTRSATAQSWTGPMLNWCEVAIFTEYARLPTAVDRLSYNKWSTRA